MARRRRPRAHTSVRRSRDEDPLARHHDVRGRAMPEGLIPLFEETELHEYAARMTEAGYGRSQPALVEDIDLDALDEELNGRS